MFCRRCGAQNEEGYRYCLRCGEPLPAPAPQPRPAWRRTWVLPSVGGILLLLLLGGSATLLLSNSRSPDRVPAVARVSATPVDGDVEEPATWAPEAETEAVPATATMASTVMSLPSSTPIPTATPLPTATRRPTATLLPTTTPPPTTTPTNSPTATPAHVRTRSRDGMVMLKVPGGSFLMGASSADSEANADERPQRTVRLETFWIDRTEVTNAQYQKCVAAGVCKASRFAGDSRFNRANKPVVGIPWSSARAYCSWVGARLPTEAEWEKAARGTDGRTYPWGNGTPNCQRANYWPGPNGCAGATAAVGSYGAGASPYKVLDMAGNVWEWVSDWYDEGYYGRSPAQDPQGPGSGSTRVVRGGSWDDGVGGIRAANRHREEPGDSARDLGFRCAADSPP